MNIIYNDDFYHIEIEHPEEQKFLNEVISLSIENFKNMDDISSLSIETSKEVSSIMDLYHREELLVLDGISKYKIEKVYLDLILNHLITISEMILKVEKLDKNLEYEYKKMHLLTKELLDGLIKESSNT
jgi:hypothetical protein